MTGIIYQTCYLIQNNSKLAIVGVHFKPGGSDAFLSLPAGELHNQIISLDELWQSRAVELRNDYWKPQPGENAA
jgi:hypothetical protein